MDNNRRQHFRVRINFPITWEIMDEKEIGIVKKGQACTLFSKKGLPSPIDELIEQASPGSEGEHLYRSLQYINNKLDFLIDRLLLNRDKGLLTHDEVVEISASGLRFSTGTNLAPGTVLKMNIILPGTFQYQMDFISEIVRAEKFGDKFISAVKILYIDETDLDSVIKVIFQKQRKDIRTVKNNTGSSID